MVEAAHNTLRAQGWNDLHDYANTGLGKRPRRCAPALEAALSA